MTGSVRRMGDDGAAMMSVDLWTDGACAGNPGPGGWAAILQSNDHVRELCGGARETTNNRMELTAVIEGLAALRRRCAVTVNVDSTYVMRAFTDGWLETWKRRGWKTAAGKPVKNPDLWEPLDLLVGSHQVRWRWHKGHSNIELNERCDLLACVQRDAHRVVIEAPGAGTGR
jgi:ribonuclease HI